MRRHRVFVALAERVAVNEGALAPHQRFHVAGQRRRGGDGIVAGFDRLADKRDTQRKLDVLLRRDLAGVVRQGLGERSGIEQQVIDLVEGHEAGRSRRRDCAQHVRHGRDAIEDDRVEVGHLPVERRLVMAPIVQVHL